MSDGMSLEVFEKLLQDGHEFTVFLGVIEYTLKHTEQGYVIMADGKVVEECVDNVEAMLALLTRVGEFSDPPSK